jgi:tetratricopeptide (TPR) repeat protein
LPQKILQGTVGKHDQAESAVEGSRFGKLLLMSLGGVLVVILAVATLGSATASASEAQRLFREGYAAGMAREWDDAIRLYSQSLKLDPSNVNAYFQRGITFEVAGRLEEAIRDYQKVLKLRPDHYLALEYLAKLYENEGRYSAALALYQKALTTVQDPKWRSIVKWWISNTQKKMKAAHKPDARATKRRYRPRGSVF